jgi:hypothetical protein
MRDTHEGMPELLAAFERDGGHFGTARVTLSGDTRDIEFGVPLEEYRALRHILQTRPFDPLSTLPCRYFIAGSIGRAGEHTGKVDIRIEQGREGRHFPFEMPLSLARNFYWFAQLRKFSDASHLHVTPVATQEV